MQCPHCLQHFHTSSPFRPFYLDSNVAEDEKGIWGAQAEKCPACERIIVSISTLIGVPAGGGHTTWLPTASRFVYPKAIARSALPAQVPEQFAADYREACLVLADSEKASAALSRRCLQRLLHQTIGIKERTLDQEITKLLQSNQLPAYLADEVDAVRNIGNLAAHPLKDTNTGEIIEVEPGEAEWLLNVLEDLFEFYFVQPVRSKARQDALNAKLAAAGKQPMKTS